MRFRSAPLPAVLLTAAAAAAALSLPASADPLPGQTDTFEDGTTQGWHVGQGAPDAALPVNVPAGGPAGADDHYLLLSAFGGNGPGGKLSGINDSLRWTGDYLTSGVGAVTMDLRNFGPSDLYLRLLFVGPFGPNGPTAVAFSTDAVFLAAGGGWTPATFRVTPGDLTGGFGSITDALSGASELRLFHNPDPSFLGPGGNAIPPVQASLGVDNVRAQAAIPEPGTLALLGAGVLPLAGALVRRRTAAAK